MKGKWAAGIEPRNFAWVIKDQLAVCERPGGYGANHRRVRRQEEIIWLRQQGFDIVFSLIPGSHNLNNYRELGLPFAHRPWPQREQLLSFLETIYGEMDTLLDREKKVVIHAEELSERVCGVVAGYLLYARLVPTGPQALAMVERIFQRHLGPFGRELVEISLAIKQPRVAD
jgi:hypothetical protein